ncbi:MAG: hypothetical protein E7549_00265 [Ruminococcaceae bacterium]|nr:hypothetical protein [Oscillospiraceae bacterium]
MRRFLKCLHLNARHTLKKQWPLFWALIFLLILLAYSVDLAVGLSLEHYDYIGHYFDRTEKPYVALSLNSRYDTMPPESLWQEVYDACGERPLVGSFTQNYDGTFSYCEYDPGLLGITPSLQSGRWLTPADADEGTLACVVSNGLATAYPLGSTFSRPTYVEDESAPNGLRETSISYQVVGILDEDEHPMVFNLSRGTPITFDRCVDLMYEGDFVITTTPATLPASTMWFQTEVSVKEMQTRLKQYGTVMSAEQLTKAYTKNKLRGIFDEGEIQLYFMLLAILITISTAVIHFGHTRRDYAVMYLLGQSRHMLTATTITLYGLAVAISVPLGILWSFLQHGVMISVARWCVVGVAAVAMLCISIVIACFFRRSPMQLFTENR